MLPGFVRILNFLGGMNLWRWGQTFSNDLILQTSSIFVVVRTANLSIFGHQSLSFLVHLENNMTFYGVTPQVEGITLIESVTVSSPKTVLSLSLPGFRS